MNPNASTPVRFCDLIALVESYPHFALRSIATFGSRSPFAWRSPETNEGIEKLRAAVGIQLMLYFFEIERERAARDVVRDGLLREVEAALGSLQNLAEALPSGRTANRVDRLRKTLSESKPGINSAVRDLACDAERKLERLTGILGTKDAERRLELRLFALLKVYVDLPDKCLYEHVRLLCLHFGIPRREGNVSARLKQAVYRAAQTGESVEGLPVEIMEMLDWSTVEAALALMESDCEAGSVT